MPFLKGTADMLDEMVMALVESANDKSEDVQRAVCSSVQTLGIKKPELVLGTCSSYLMNHPKLPTKHRILILKIIYKICEQATDFNSNELSVTIIKQATEEMVASKDIIPEWQGAASNILVSLGRKWCHEVMESLLLKFQPGIVPHFFVIQTLAHLASRNVYGMVPFLKSVLGTLLSIISLIHHENIKWVTAFAIARFGDAVTEYIANIDKAPDQTVRREVYESEFNIAYDSLINWLPGKDMKLRIMIIEALGTISHNISCAKFEEKLVKVLTTIFAMYRKPHSEINIVTQSFCMILDAGFENKSPLLDSHVDPAINVLFPQICDIPDLAESSLIKNRNEVLRCFCSLVTYHPDAITLLLTSSLESNNEKNRVGGLILFRHFVNMKENCLHDKMPSILALMKVVTLDNNHKVKLSLAHLIVSLAHHGHLEQADTGPLLIEFLIRHCSTEESFENISELSIRNTCENVLNVISTTVPNIEKVLWPDLLNYIIPLKYSLSVVSVCKNAAYFAMQLRNSDTTPLEIEYSKLANINEPTVLLARLLVLSSDKKQYRHSTLQLMKALGPTFHKNLVPTMDAQIPNLLSLLADDEKHLTVDEWENHLLKFLTQLTNDMDQEDWCKALGRALANQIQLYTDLPKSKAFLFKCLGEIIKKVNDEIYTRIYLETIFSATRHTDEIEREGCAIAFGRSAITHLDITLVSLYGLSKPDTSKKHTGFFSFFTDTKSEVEQEIATKCTLILCYGYISSLSPTTRLLSHLESDILKFLLSQFQHAQKSKDIKFCLLRAIGLLTEALHPSQFNKVLKQTVRLDLINHVQLSLKDANTNELINLSLECITNLIQMEPVLPASEWEKCLKLCTQKVYAPNDSSELPNEETVNILNRLLHTLLEREPTSENLYFITCHLDSWLSSDKVNERQQSVSSLVKLLDEYLNIYSLKGDVNKNIIRFSPMGSILARLVPRCSDNDVTIRQMAVGGIAALFKLAASFDGLSTEYFESTFSRLDVVRSQLSTQVNAEVLFQTITNLGQVIASNLPSHQVIPFLHVLFDGLLDPINSCSAGVCVVFNAVVRNRGGELHQQVDVLLQLLHRQFNSIEHANTRKAALQIVRNIGSHHLIPVVDFLLNCPAPAENAVAYSWQALAQDPTLNRDVLNHLLQNLSLSSPCVYEQVDPRHTKEKIVIATPRSIAVLYALKEMFQQPEMESVVTNHFTQLVASHILICGVFVDAYLPPPPEISKPLWPPLSVLKRKDSSSPIRVAVDSLNAFLLCAQKESIVNMATDAGCWSNLENIETFPDAIVCLTRALCKHAPETISRVVSLLSPAITGSAETHRILSVAFFGELIRQRCNSDSVLLELVMNSLVNMLIDSSHIVRRLSIRGLGYIVEIGTDEFGTLEWFGIHKYSTTVLSAMLVGLDDKEDFKGDIALEAMNGLSKMLVEIDTSLVAPVLISIVLRIRTNFENTRPDVRQTAFRLFGDLSKFAIGESAAGFLEQIHNNFSSLLLHLNDADRNVIKSCKHALRNLGPLLECQSVNTMFQKHLINEGELHYGEFMNYLSKILVSEFANKVPLYVTSTVMYFKSSWTIIQANAAMLTGCLLTNLPEQIKLLIDKEATCTALMLLLKCEDKLVRIKAAEAMSMLHQY